MEFKSPIEIEALQLLKLKDSTTLTLASGVATVTQSFHKLDTEGAAATDDLTTFTGLVDGTVYYFHAVSAARVITVKHGTANIYTSNAADIVLDATAKVLTILASGGDALVVNITSATGGGGGTIQGADHTYDLLPTNEGSTAGDTRGENSADFQTNRAVSTQVASGANSTIPGGRNNTASGSDSLAGGYGSTASGAVAVAVGQSSTASGDYARSGGLSSKADKHGQDAYAGGVFSAAGDAQMSALVVRNQTTNATQTELFLDGATASRRATIASDTTWLFEIFVVARRTDADNESAGYKFQGVLDNNAGTTALVGLVVKTIVAEDTSAWDATVEADNTNDALVVKVTGEAAKTINWVARIELTEVTG